MRLNLAVLQMQKLHSSIVKELFMFKCTDRKREVVA